MTIRRRRSNGLTFFVYTRGTTTVVFWQEGETICVALSDGPTEDVVAFAFAKAINPDRLPGSPGAQRVVLTVGERLSPTKRSNGIL